MSGLTGVLHSPLLNKDSSRIQNYVLTVILSYHVLSDAGYPILTVILVISIITWKCIRYYIIGKENLHGVDGAAAVITPDNLCSDTTLSHPGISGHVMGRRWPGHHPNPRLILINWLTQTKLNNIWSSTYIRSHYTKYKYYNYLHKYLL